MSILKISHHQWPNGGHYAQFKIDEQGIGLANVVPDGYIGFNRRKPVRTVEDAARQLIERDIQRKRRALARLEMALAELPIVKGTK